MNRLTFEQVTSSRFGLAYWEPLVDGRPVRGLLHDPDATGQVGEREHVGPAGESVPVLVHNWPVAGTDGAEELLGRKPSALPGGRVALYVCSVCGDAGCGVVSAAVEWSEATVVWREFGWDTDWDDGEDDIRFEGGPFVFDREQYEGELLRFVETYAAVRASVPAYPASAAPSVRPTRRSWWPWSR
ncbi:hypothetical protein ACTHAM_001001 [Cellulomonas soli]|uniref:hypothetical protein n=1 Tax=Cellulomonas soli TaxID=931535 RepID=UPI001D25FEDF|nr:hypothetical protein [Cellulomonadaceae bacterium]